MRLNGGTGLSTHSLQVALPGLRLFPNPAGSRGSVQLQAEIGAVAATVRVLTTLGQLVRTQEPTAPDRGHAELALAGLTPGTYLVQLRTASGRQLVQRLVVF